MYRYRVILICFVLRNAFCPSASQAPIAGTQLEIFKSCIEETGVDISYPSNDTWWYDSQCYHIPVLRHPLAVAYAESTSEVQELVKCATKCNVKICPRSGGHSYEAFSNEDYHLVIDVTRIDSVNISDCDNTATVGAGIRLGRLYYELGENRLTFPGGTCSTVGLGGLVGAGGYGFLERMWGLAADNVLELEMVDYRGEVLLATNETNQDLFFALRGGGGGSYGIVTQMKLQVYSYPKLATAFAIDWNQPIPASDLSKTWFRWKPWNSMPREMSCVMDYAYHSSFLGFYLGDDGHLGVERILNESGLMQLGPIGSQTYKYYSSDNLQDARAWLDNFYVHYGNDTDYHVYNTPTSFVFKPLSLPPYPTPVYPTWESIQNDSRVNATHLNDSAGSLGPIPNQEPLLVDREYAKFSSQILVKEFDEAAYAALDEFVNQEDCLIQLKPFGGITYIIPDDFNAFPHRRQPFLMQYMTPYFPTGDQKNTSENILKAMEPYTNHMSYQGYADLFWTPDPQIYMPRYYGQHVERLVQAKVAYDPQDFFSNEQSTPTHFNTAV